MIERSLADYGAPYVDRTPVVNPTVDASAEKRNLLFEDVAQLTRTGYRAIVKFIANASGNPPAADVAVWTMLGGGSSQKPAVTRSGAGLYTLAFTTPQADGLGESVDITFFSGHVSVTIDNNNVVGGDLKAIAGPQVRIKVFSAGVLSDLGGTGVVTVWLR